MIGLTLRGRSLGYLPCKLFELYTWPHLLVSRAFQNDMKFCTKQVKQIAKQNAGVHLEVPFLQATQFKHPCNQGVYKPLGATSRVYFHRLS